MALFGSLSCVRIFVQATSRISRKLTICSIARDYISQVFARIPVYLLVDFGLILIFAITSQSGSSAWKERS